MNKLETGQVAQSLVHIYLVKKGYLVYTQDYSQPVIDLVAINNKTGETLYIDCKALARRTKDNSRINRILSDNQRDFIKRTGNKIMLVYADLITGEIETTEGVKI
jgi:hypothetical protein